MLVALVTGALKERSERAPAALLAVLGRALCGQTEGGFVTCCAVRFGDDGAITVANAGILPPYLDRC